MPVGRTAFALVVTFVCALLVFTLPRFAWNTLRAAQHPDTTAVQHADTAQAAAPAAATPQQLAPDTRTLPQRLVGLFGIVAILGLGVLLSHNRRAISWRVVAWGVGLQFGFALFVLRSSWGHALFATLGSVGTAILAFSYEGSKFVSGVIGEQHSSLGVSFAFQVLPAIIFISALFAILYYLGVMQQVVKAFAVLMHKVMGASGAESLNVAASIFMGQTEAPLTIRPYLSGMTRSELM